MLTITNLNEIDRFDLARNLPFRWRYWTTAYYVDGLLIDSGCAHVASNLLNHLATRKLQTLVTTHSHEVHIGAHGLLQRRYPNLAIFAHPLALKVIANPRQEQPLHPYRRLFWGWPESACAEPLLDGAEIETENFCFRVLYTPGHSPDHCCFYEPTRGWLFTGDLYVGGEDRALREGYNIYQIIESLKRIAKLDITTLFPGSARIPFNGIEAINKKIRYLEELGARIRSLHHEGMSLRAIVRTVCGGPMPVEIITLGHFTRRRLILSYLYDVNN